MTGHVKLLVALTLGAALMYAIAQYLLTRDVLAKDAQIFVENDAEVAGVVGSIEAVRLFERVRIHASSGRPAYQVFRFEVSGNDGQASVDVKVTDSDKDSKFVLHRLVPE